MITRSSRRKTDSLFEDPPWDCGVASVETAEQLMQETGKRMWRRRQVPAAFERESQNVEGGVDCR